MVTYNCPLLWISLLTSPLTYVGHCIAWPLEAQAFTVEEFIQPIDSFNDVTQQPRIQWSAIRYRSPTRIAQAARTREVAQETIGQDLPNNDIFRSSDFYSLEDPELGNLRLIELPVESVEILDPELGILRLQEIETPQRDASPSIYLQAYTNFFWTDNVLSVADDPVSDGIFQLGLSINAFPDLGSRTYLLASVGGALVRYSDEENLAYNDISFSLGLYHTLTRRSYLEFGWNNDQFFDSDTGDRFLDDHSFYVAVGRRDSLAPRFSFDTAYEIEYNLANPVERNRVINEFSASLEYQITPNLETDLTYRWTFVDFTKQDRNDAYHQLVLGVQYDLSSESQISFFGGQRFGDSSERFLDFDSALIGVNISINLPLF